MELLRRYINQGRFGEFVAGFLEAEYNRREETALKEREMRLWIAYVHSYSSDPYEKWKKGAVGVEGNGKKTAQGNDESLDDDGIKAIISGLFPN